MRYIQKFFESKKSIEKFIEKNGMEEAIQEYGLNKLLMFKLIFQYKGTKLYYDDNFSVITKVYNEEGKYLGMITQLMSPFYKKLGHYFGPCLNGNVILCQNNSDFQGKTYALFDKDGKYIIPYGVYNSYEFLPNGVALMGNKNESAEKVTTIHYDGTFNVQLFDRVETVMGDEEYEYILHNTVNSEDKTLKVNKDIMDELMYNSRIKFGTKEKGIE